MKPNPIKCFLRVLLALFFIFTGTMHFVRPASFVDIVPPFLPHPHALVVISGVFEILGGLGLLVPGLRRLAGYGLILLLIAVFPANIYMLMQGYQQNGFSTYTIILILRLPLQFIFMHIVNVLSKYP
jgi:uncharacterized membrane protein